MPISRSITEYNQLSGVNQADDRSVADDEAGNDWIEQDSTETTDDNDT
jgi:hypothetical protein